MTGQDGCGSRSLWHWEPKHCANGVTLARWAVCCIREYLRERMRYAGARNHNCDLKRMSSLIEVTIYPLPPPVSSLFLSPPPLPPMLSARSVGPLPLSDRLPFPSSSPRPPPQPLDLAMDGLPPPSHHDASTTPPQSPSTVLSTSEQVFGILHVPFL